MKIVTSAEMRETDRRTAEEFGVALGELMERAGAAVARFCGEVYPAAKRVDTDAGSFTGDVLVVALGADLDPAATPGLVEGGNEFYTIAGAIAAGRALADFDGGNVVVGVTSTPFKCPPAPSETALLVHDHLTARGLRDRSTISLVIAPSPAAISRAW